MQDLLPIEKFNPYDATVFSVCVCPNKFILRYSLGRLVPLFCCCF